MSLFDFLDEQNADDNTSFNAMKVLCRQLENEYKVISKSNVASQIRYIIEDYASYRGWGNSNSQFNTLSNRIRNAHERGDTDNEQNDNLVRLKEYGNIAHHTNINNDYLDDYNKATKAEIFILLINTLKSVCYGGHFYDKTNETELFTLPYYSKDSRITYTFSKCLNEEYKHYLYKYKDSYCVIRELDTASVNREQDVNRMLIINAKDSIIDRCHLSNDVVYEENGRQVKVFSLAGNEKSLSQYVESKGGKLNIVAAIEIIYQLSSIVKDLLDVGDGANKISICHRNINPNTIFIQSNQDGKLKVKLSCFDHAKIHINSENSAETIPTLTWDKVLQHDSSSQYIYKKIVEERIREDRTISFDNSKIMDIYAISKVLIYISTGQLDGNSFITRNSNNSNFNSGKNKNKIKTQNRSLNSNRTFSDDFRNYISACLRYLDNEAELRNIDFFKMIENEYGSITGNVDKLSVSSAEENNSPQSIDKTDEIHSQISNDEDINYITSGQNDEERRKTKNIIIALAALASVLAISLVVVLIIFLNSQ